MDVLQSSTADSICPAIAHGNAWTLPDLPVPCLLCHSTAQHNLWAIQCGSGWAFTCKMFWLLHSRVLISWKWVGPTRPDAMLPLVLWPHICTALSNATTSKSTALVSMYCRCEQR